MLSASNRFQTCILIQNYQHGVGGLRITNAFYQQNEYIIIWSKKDCEKRMKAQKKKCSLYVIIVCLLPFTVCFVV